MPERLPYLQLYVNDLMNDPALQACSLAAFGLWVKMICIMHKAPRRGFLSLNGLPLSSETVSRMVGGAHEEVLRLTQELEDAGVFSRDDNRVIYSRRMVSDERKRQKCSEAGRKGGGSPLLSGISPPIKVLPKVGPKVVPKVESDNVIAEGGSGGKPAEPLNAGIVVPTTARRSLYVRDVLAESQTRADLERRKWEMENPELAEKLRSQELEHHV
jgi:hypothetical protein